MTPLERVLRRVAADFAALGLRWALVGGFAVSARAEPRTTRDLAVAVADDRDAERVILALRQRGYRDAGQVLEHDVTGRLATMRMVISEPEGEDTVVDLLFASTGIEPEIVEAATPIEVLPGLTVGVASLAHLLAMKALAGRRQDVADFVSLFRLASPEDLEAARMALALVTARRTNRSKDLAGEFDGLCDIARREG